MLRKIVKRRVHRFKESENLSCESKIMALQTWQCLVTSQGMGTWGTRFGRNPLNQIGHNRYHWKAKETTFLKC